jgi:translation initiation factor IF-3
MATYPKRNFHNNHQSEFRANQRIRAREVLVIDPSGKSLGILPIMDAISAAKRFGLDLVEVSPNANPPVCKIINFGKFRYENEKREKDAKKHNLAAKVKELKFHINIDENDYNVKMRHAEGFMLKGMKVKIAMVFRGRELQHKDLGQQIVARIRQDLSHVGLADMEPKLIGKSINMMLTPIPEKKRVRKFTKEEDPDIEEAEESQKIG